LADKSPNLEESSEYNSATETIIDPKQGGGWRVKENKAKSY